MALNIWNTQKYTLLKFLRRRTCEAIRVMNTRASVIVVNRGLVLADPKICDNKRSMFSTFSAKYNQNQTDTVDEEEVKKFSRIAETWWNTSGEFEALHTLNDLRIPLIRDALTNQPKDIPRADLLTGRPLSGFSILDVGCGGGILCEPLTRLGAEVTGIDASHENIKMAKWHANLDPSISDSVTYQCAPVEDLVQEGNEGNFDAVVASEILEHVSDNVGFVASCCSLVKPGGSIFFTTINKTIMARMLAIYTAENILGIVPQGSHDWEKFVPPEDLQFLLTQNKFTTRLVHGMFLNPCTMKWSWMADTSMNYAIHATKPNK